MITALLFAATTQVLNPGLHLKETLVVGSSAIFQGDPRVVAPAGCVGLWWSSDGSYLMVQRKVVPNPRQAAEQSLIGEGAPTASQTEFQIYGKASGKSNVVLRLPAGYEVDEVNWISGSSKAIITLSWSGDESEGPGMTAYLVTAAGQSRNLYPTGHRDAVEAFPSPLRPYVVMRETVFHREGQRLTVVPNLSVLDSDGVVMGKPVEVPGGSTVEFSPEGKIMVGDMRPSTGTKRTWNLLNPTSGTLTPVPTYRHTDPQSLVKPLPFDAMQTGYPLSKESRLMSPAVVLFERDKRSNYVVVSTDASEGALSPKGNAVAYVHRGVAMVRDLTNMDREAYEAMKAAAEKMVALSNAKQTALALIMNAADNDDNLPNSSGDWKSQIGPYLKDSGVASNFVMVFAGGSMTSIESPAETILGYIPGPGGNAIAYTDGHVKWVSGPLPQTKPPTV